jgi:hypothetical protein
MAGIQTTIVGWNTQDKDLAAEEWGNQSTDDRCLRDFHERLFPRS